MRYDAMKMAQHYMEPLNVPFNVGSDSISAAGEFLFLELPGRPDHACEMVKGGHHTSDRC